jgi:nucleotide-binding universal stress UspA family protein
MIKTILLATDGSPHSWSAWNYAVDLARAYHAVLKAISIVDVRLVESPWFWNVGETERSETSFGRIEGLTPDALQRALEERSQEILLEVQQRCAERGVRCKTEIARGVPSQVICLEESTADVLVLGHRGVSGKFQSILGSTAEAVIRCNNKPILISPHDYRPLERVLMAHDGSDHADRALQIAADLCVTLKKPLIVLSVHRNVEMGNAIVREAMEYLEPYELDAQPQVRHGHPADQILAVAAESDCRLIVMGAYGHTHIRETLIGSTTEEVLRKTSVPMLVVK